MSRLSASAAICPIAQAPGSRFVEAQPDEALGACHGLGIVERVEEKTILGTTCGFFHLRIVSNDTTANYLFLNHGGKHFEEIGFSAGVAYSEEGNPRSGMGVDSGDYDNDGWMDLYVDNIDHQRFALYRNDHDLTFTDVSGITGIGAATELRSGWGMRFIDYDNDGWLDILQTDGHPDDMVSSYDLDVHYHEKPLLFHNNGHGGFTDVSAHAGTAFQRRWGARGLATGDYDNDGRPDLFVVRFGRSQLFKNLDGRKFREVTREAGLDRAGNAITAVAFDHDLDGDLDGDDYFRIDSNVAQSGSAFGFHNGDFDYDGDIDGDDYFILDSAAAAAGSWGWFNGDFDYNGKINGDDYFLIDSNIGRQGVLL